MFPSIEGCSIRIIFFYLSMTILAALLCLTWGKHDQLCFFGFFVQNLKRHCLDVVNMFTFKFNEPNDYNKLFFKRDILR